MSDGEWNEGSNWEALVFLKQHRLDNLTLIVDLNELQGMGPTREIADLAPLADKFRAFGLPTMEVNGHDCTSLSTALRQREPAPVAIVGGYH